MKNVNRRRFIGAATGGALVAGGAQLDPASWARAQERTTLEGHLAADQTDTEVKLGNSKVQFRFHRASGALLSIENRAASRHLNVSPAAAAPLRLWLGTQDEPDQAQVAVTQSNAQQVDFRLLRSQAEVLLTLHWDDLSEAGFASGVAVTQTCSLSAGDDFLRIRTTLENRGSRWITGAFLGLESLAVNSDPSRETLRSGTVWGKAFQNPRHELPEESMIAKFPAGKRSYSIPPAIPGGLIVSWMDLSDPDWGIGTGYLDRQEMDLVGDIQASPDGLTLGWRLFRLTGSRGFMWSITDPKLIYPLAPGEQFVSDEWLLVAHHGDWHGTADAYRKRYEVAFRGDFLNWKSTSPAVRQSDIILNSHIAWGKFSKDRSRAYDYPIGRVVNRFEDLPEMVEDAIEKLGVEPQNVIVNVLGTGRRWGIYEMPDHFPMNQEAGGQDAAEAMTSKLRQLGVAGINVYAHPYFNHRKAKNYVPEADTGWNYPHKDWHTSIGGIASIAERKWQELWVNEIYPKYAAMGVNGLYFDEGFGHQFIPQHPSTSQSALSVLTAQSRGATALYRSWRRVVGSRAFLSCEGGSDVQARFIDLWHLDPTEVLRYTHPDRLLMTGLRKDQIAESVGRALVFGCPLLIAPFPGLAGIADKLEGEVLKTLRKFVRLRREMRRDQAPGYPYRFRDTNGLTIKGGNLLAKCFASEKGATVVYFAPQAFDGKIRLDGSQLGIPSLGTEEKTVTAAEKDMGYLVF